MGEIAEFQYGNYDGKGEDRGKYNLVRITDLNEYGNISEKDLKYTDLLKEFKTDKFLSKGGVVVSRQAFPARVGIFEGEKAVLSSNLIKVKFDKELLLSKYFLWFSQTQEWDSQVRQLTKGTAQPVFSANSLKEIQIPIPNLENQKKIISEKEIIMKIINYQKRSIKLLKEKEERFSNNLWEK